MSQAFTPAAVPDDEAWRLQSLLDLNVLDTAPEAEFDALVKVASLVCGVPISLISLVDADRQWFKADVGLGATQTPRDIAFCSHAILGNDIFEVEDALHDQRFAGNPLVQGAPDIRFYAGAPIVLTNGAHVGTLCVIDREPRKLTDLQKQVLVNLGIAVTQALEARKDFKVEKARVAVIARDAAVERSRVSLQKMKVALQEASALNRTIDIHAIVSEADRNGVITHCNDAFERISGYSREELIGQNHRIVKSGYQPQSFWEEMWHTISSGKPWRGEICNRAKDGRLYWVDSMIAPFIGADGLVEKYVSIRTDITHRVVAQRQLGEMSLRMNLAIEGGNDGLWDWPDVHQEAQWWSPSYFAMLGYSDSELESSRKSYLTLLHPDFVQSSRQANKAALAGGHILDLTVQLKTKSRGYRWFRVRAKTGLDAQGRSASMAGSTQDIHEQKMAEEALLSNKLLLDTSQAIAKVGGWELDLRSGHLFWTEETYRIHETSPDTFNPSVDAGVGYFLPDSKRRITEALDAAIARGEGYDLELETYTTKGNLIDVRTTCVVTMADGKAVKLTGIFQDITERKRNERALRAAKDRMELATQSGGIGIWVFDLVKNALQWDERMYALYGIARHSQLEPYNVWSDSVHPEDRAASEKSLQEAIEGKRDFDVEFRIIWPDQSIRHIHGTARVERDTAGKPVQMVGVNFDITDQKNQASALLAAKDLAEQLAQSKSQFLANMSHEIRTPMNAILGMLKLLQSTELTDRQQDYASKTEGAAQSLLGLLNDILDFSKVEAGKMTLESEPFRIDQLLRNLSVILSANVGSKDIEVLFDVDASLPALVLGDAMRLQQVLINLGGNAVKFTSTGQVVLFLRKRSQTDSTVTIEFAVQDSGIGIAPEHLGHIFSGFSQAEGSTTRRFGGTGLGLAISQRLVALMGGEIQTSSQPGVGSTFTFSIEFPTLVGGADGTAEPLPPIFKSARALIVDDNPIAGNLTQRMARSFGWSVDLVTSGHEAIDMVSAQLTASATPFPYSVIFMDCNMPEMDGWEATRQIRALAEKHKLDQPMVVMVTAHGRETLAHRTEDEQGLINGFLVKPVTAAMLYEAWMDAGRGNTGVRKLVPGRSSKRQLQGLRVLVVEDNMINQQVADELLSAEGAIVSLAANGQLGVDAVAAAAPQFDVVLMDLQMPVLDGYGATRFIRENLHLTDLPIVAMTANAMASDRDACLAGGMTEHIGKPFDMAKLVSLLIRLTGFQGEAQATGALGAAAMEDVPQLVPEVVGLDIASALNRMSGLRSLYVRTARDFVKIMDDIPAELRQCLATEDKQRAVRCLHTLKGNAGTLGATELAAMAGTLEKLCSTGEGMKACAEKLDLLEGLIRRTQEQMTEAITRLNSESVVPATNANKGSSQTVGVIAWDALQSIADLAKAEDMAVLMEFADSRERLEGLPAEFMERLEEALQNLDLGSVASMCEEALLQRDTGR